MSKKVRSLFNNKKEFLYKNCNKENCHKPGKFKAPRSPDNLKKYIWFCEEHIREYNKSWNYCKNMNQEEIEQHIKQDVVGWRPTWDFSYRTPNINDFKKIFSNYFNFFSNKKDKCKKTKRKTEIQKAFKILKVNNEFYSLKEIEIKYKKLVKKYHPDKNNGNKKHEETLKKINQAFTIIKKSFSKKISLSNLHG